MTQEMKELAQLHAQAFVIGGNDFSAQGEYLLKTLTEKQFNVGGNALMADADAAVILRDALKQHHRRNFEVLEREGKTNATIARHINHARSSAKVGVLGYFTD
jgi:hypothetical protein